MVPKRVLPDLRSDGISENTAGVIEVNLLPRNCFLATRVYCKSYFASQKLSSSHHNTYRSSLIAVIFMMKECLSRNCGVNDISCGRTDEIQASLPSNVTGETKRDFNCEQ